MYEREVHTTIVHNTASSAADDDHKEEADVNFFMWASDRQYLADHHIAMVTAVFIDAGLLEASD